MLTGQRNGHSSFFVGFTWSSFGKMYELVGFCFFFLNKFELWCRVEFITNADQYSINTLVLGCVYLLKNSIVVVQASKSINNSSASFK